MKTHIERFRNQEGYITYRVNGCQYTGRGSWSKAVSSYLRWEGIIIIIGSLKKKKSKKLS